MTFARSSGFLLHPTSLPGKYGIGDLGQESYNFINFLKSAGQSLWQVCPLGPTGYGDSPYQCFSAFAGNPLLISPELLIKDGLLKEKEIPVYQTNDTHNVDFGSVIGYKNGLYRTAFEHFKEGANAEMSADYEHFCKKQKAWLEDYALFMACKNHHGGSEWTKWDAAIALRKKGAVNEWKKKLADEYDFYRFVQFLFFRQWDALHKYALSQGIKVVGDMPIFVAFDSSDVWANKELFTVDETGKLEFVAGVPPDYFSPTGQLWGNPLYRWKEMEKDNFSWWKKRFKALLELVDIVRIDHFRGFEAYWEIPGNAPTAETGRWVKAPGKKLFKAVLADLGDIPILAEDLGLITKEVEELRDSFSFPGMKILQFAFGKGMEKKFLPHNFTANCVVYSGSHDNDTTRGYFEAAQKQDNDIYSFTREYLNYGGNDLTFEVVRTAMASVANIVIIPMQDVLNLGSEARMNFPGRLGGNWTFRYSWLQVDPGLAGIYRKMSELYERNGLK